MSRNHGMENSLVQFYGLSTIVSYLISNIVYKYNVNIDD